MRRFRRPYTELTSEAAKQCCVCTAAAIYMTASGDKGYCERHKEQALSEVRKRAKIVNDRSQSIGNWVGYLKHIEKDRGQ